MTGLAVREPRAVELDAPAMLVSWARAATAAHELAVGLCQTEFVPEHFRNKPAEAAAAILHGAEIGLSPLQALQGIYVIAGRPALYAKVKLAITQARGHKVWTEDETPTRVVVCGQRAGSAKVERVTWTIERAQKAGYTRRNSNYASSPQEMLWARAVSAICGRIASDALAGLATVEDMQDEQAAGEPAEPERPAKRTAQRRPLQTVPLPEPDLDGPEDAAQAPQAAPSEPEPPDLGHDTGEQVSEPQRRKLFAVFKGLGITDRDDRLRVASAVLQLDVATFSDLTMDQATTLIDAISGAKAGDLLKLPAPQQTGSHPFKGLDPDDPCPECGLSYDDEIHGPLP